MRILAIQHSAADSPAAAGRVLDVLGHSLQTVRIDRKESIPEEVDCDALMMFGGPFSMTSDKLPSWVAQEQSLIRKYVDRGARVMGVCLGAQILATALGADVRRNGEPEVGWHEVSRVRNDSAITNGAFPDRMRVFQWHQDTFEIPPGATRLYESDVCANQAFTIDDRVFGFQFHLEADARTVRTFVAVSPLRKVEAPQVQSEAEIQAGISDHLPSQTDRLTAFLSRFMGD